MNQTTLTIPEATMMEVQQSLNLDELSHHGILGMKWYVRRFQKYPAGYSGDGKYVGPDGGPREATRKEKRADKKYNKIKSAINEGVRRAIDDSDKKLLKAAKPALGEEEYQKKYDELVKTGVARSIKMGDVKGLKKFKKDMTKTEYKDAVNLLKFNDAVNRLDVKEMNKRISKIKNDDLKVAAERIGTITSLQKTKIEALKVESETSARIAKIAKTAGSVADLTDKALKIYNNVTGIRDKIREGSKAEKKRIEAENKEQIEKAIKTGDPEQIAKWKGKMTLDQIEKANRYVYLEKRGEIADKIKQGKYNEVASSKYASYLSGKDIDELVKIANFSERKRKDVPNVSNSDSFNQYLNQQQNQNGGKKKKKK